MRYRLTFRDVTSPFNGIGIPKVNPPAKTSQHDLPDEAALVECIRRERPPGHRVSVDQWSDTKGEWQAFPLPNVLLSHSG